MKLLMPLQADGALHITDPLWGESTCDQWIPLIEGPSGRS